MALALPPHQAVRDQELDFILHRRSMLVVNLHRLVELVLLHHHLQAAEASIT